MGSSSSKANLGVPIGSYFNGKMIYEKDRAIINRMISEGKLTRVVDVTPEGHEPWVYMDKELYSRPASSYRKYWNEHKGTLIKLASGSAKVSTGVALNVAKIALPILIDSGTAAAAAAVAIEAPELAPVAGPIIAALNKGLTSASTSIAEKGLSKLYGDSPPNEAIIAAAKAASEARGNTADQKVIADATAAATKAVMEGMLMQQKRAAAAASTGSARASPAPAPAAGKVLMLEGPKTGAGELGFYDTVDDSAYRGAAERFMQGGFTGGAEYDDSDDVFGGCGCRDGFVGAEEMGLDTVKDYARSVNSKAKVGIINDILETIEKMGVTISGKTQPERVKSLLNFLAADREFKSDPAVQKRVCTGIAEALNRTYGNVVIDTKLPADVICQQVAEIISSLESGMYSEFLAVYNDVRRVLKNLHVLRKSLDLDHDAIMRKIRASDDALLLQQVTSLDDLHKLISSEVSRQIEMLSNLLNVTLFPSERDLATLIKSKKELHGYIEKIDPRIGSGAFGRVISNILKGMGLTANFALVVEKALKTVGMTIDEYAAGENVQKLREALTKNIMGRSFSEDELHRYLDAAELLYKNFYRNKSIADMLKSGERVDVEGDNIADVSGSRARRASARGGAHGGIHGGAHDDEFMGGVDIDKYHRTVMDKRLADRKKLRGLIFNAFYRQLNSNFDQFVNNLNVLTSKVGTEIPLSDQLDGFRHVLQRVNEELVRNKQIYHALIGYYNDAVSKSKKDTLLADLRMVESYVDTILEMSLYASSAQYFRAVKDQIRAIIMLIDKFSDEIAAKFGRGEDSEFACSYLESDDDDGDSAGVGAGGARAGKKTGAAESDGPLGLEREPRVLYTTTKTIHDAIRQFDYKYRVAQIRANMQRSSAELSHYSEKYEKIMATAIADMLEREKKIYDKVRKHLASDDLYAKAGAAAVTYHANNVVGLKSTTDVSQERAAALRFMDSQWEAKKKFWATVEAVDTYMRVFTDALVKNPNDVREIKAMLDEIEVINDWYSDDTGNNLAGVFDHFPSMLVGMGSVQNEVYMPPDDYKAPADGTSRRKHYYERIGNKVESAAGTDREKAGATLPGNPYLVTLPSHGERARAQAKRVLTGMAVLKNLLSVFVHVGSKFGGVELRKKVFMTPTQMYNNILEYMQASAFAQGFGLGEFSPEGDDMPAHYNDGDEISTGITLADGTRTNPTADTLTIDGINISASYATDHSKVHAGAISHHAAGLTLTDAAHGAALFRKRWGVWMRSVIPALRGEVPADSYESGITFRTEDDYFVMMMKSIAAKIFTVTGMYDVMDRPMEFNGLSPIRMITGGAPETPKIEVGAVALYLRLPLLAQFYRNIFGFEGDDSSFTEYKDMRRRDTNVKISMVPDIDGVFAGLIRLIFRKTKYVDASTYSDDDIKEIVREVNVIYQRMSEKHPKNTVMETIYELVAEMNRRYGIVAKGERDDYEREFGYRYDYATGNTFPGSRYDESPETAFAILPGEGDEETVRPSPSQRLLGLKFEKGDKKSMFNVTTQHRDLVYRFRCMIDKFFNQPDEDISFNQAIKAAEMKLRKESRDEERFKVVCSLVRGVDIYSKVDGMKYVLFHETVVNGLNTLSAMHSMLARFKRKVALLDLRRLEDWVWEALIESAVTAAAADEVSPESIITKIVQKYNGMGLEDQSDRIEDYLNKVFGFAESTAWNGGRGKVQSFNLIQTDGIVGAAIPRIKQLFIKLLSPTGASVNFKDTAPDSHYCVFDAAVTAGGDAHHNGNDYILSNILGGWNVEILRDSHRNETTRNKNARRVARAFMRFLFNREFIMKELLETLFGFSHDFQGLVTLKIEDGRIYMSYGGLKTLIEDMFQHVSYFMDLLRPHVSREILDKYTNKYTPGSYYWLHEQIMEKIIVGRPPQLSSLAPAGEAPKVGYMSLDELAQRISYTYEVLTCEYDFDGTTLGLSVAAAGTVGVLPGGKKSRNSFASLFADMVFYNANKPGSGLIKSTEKSMVSAGNTALSAETFDASTYEATGSAFPIDFMHNPYDALHIAGPAGAKVLDTRYSARFHQLYTWNKELTFNRSALFSFNQLVAKFIQNFYDPASQKIYSGIVNQFANGSFSRAVIDPMYTYPDVVPSWFLHVGPPVDVKIPTDIAMKAQVPSEFVRDVDIMKDLLERYFKYGLTPTDKDDKDARQKLTSLSDVGGEIPSTSSYDIFTDGKLIEGDDPSSGGKNKTLTIYVGFLIHALARVVYEMLTNIRAAMGSSNAGLVSTIVNDMRGKTKDDIGTNYRIHKAVLRFLSIIAPLRKESDASDEEKMFLELQKTHNKIISDGLYTTTGAARRALWEALDKVPGFQPYKAKIERKFIATGTDAFVLFEHGVALPVPYLEPIIAHLDTVTPKMGAGTPADINAMATFGVAGVKAAVAAELVVQEAKLNADMPDTHPYKEIIKASLDMMKEPVFLTTVDTDAAASHATALAAAMGAAGADAAAMTDAVFSFEGRARVAMLEAANAYVVKWQIDAGDTVATNILNTPGSAEATAYTDIVTRAREWAKRAPLHGAPALPLVANVAPLAFLTAIRGAISRAVNPSNDITLAGFGVDQSIGASAASRNLFLNTIVGIMNSFDDSALASWQPLHYSTFKDLVNAYTGRTNDTLHNDDITYDAIYAKLLEGGISKITRRINMVIRHYSTKKPEEPDSTARGSEKIWPLANEWKFSIYCPFSILFGGDVVDIRGTKIGATLGVQSDLSPYAAGDMRYIFSELLRMPDRHSWSNEDDKRAAFGGITKVVLSAFVMPDALGADSKDEARNIDLLSHMFAIVHGATSILYSSYKSEWAVLRTLSGTVADAAKRIDEKSKAMFGRTDKWKDDRQKLFSAMSRTGSSYWGTVVAAPKHLAKYEDLLTVNTSMFYAKTSTYQPTIDTNFLIAGRSEDVGSWLKSNNIMDFGAPDPGPGNIGDSGKLKNLMTFGRRWDPDADHVLYTSLSVILKNLISTRTTTTQVLVYMQDNIADVPLYMKERMRANLPAFRNHFRALVNRCEYLKLMMSQRSINMERDFLASGSTDGPTHNPWPFVLKKPVSKTKTVGTIADVHYMPSDETKTRFTGILDSIIRGCLSLISTCEQVLREVGDDPKFFETHQGSIKDYKGQYGVDPLMPLSSTLAFLRNSTHTSYLDFFPVHSLGEDAFKYAYGTRGILGQPTTSPAMDQVAGFQQIIDSFNLLIEKNMQVDPKRAEDYMRTFLRMSRYLFEAKHIKGLLTPHILIDTDTRRHPNQIPFKSDEETVLHVDGLFTRNDLVVTDKVWGNSGTSRSTGGTDHNATIYPERGGHNDAPLVLTNKSDVSLIADGADQQAAQAARKLKYPVPVYSVSHTLTDTLSLTESSFKDEKIKELVEYLHDKPRRRNRLDIQNIIDLNIIPINVHALMREIPLANLYNYSYTFDRLIIELYYGLKNENARKLIGELCNYDAGSTADQDKRKGNLGRITSAKDMLVALLLNPYMDVFNADAQNEHQVDPSQNLYERYVKSMLTGVPNNGELGRPKFLSDQIYNKAIFGEVYEVRQDYNEMGPPAARAITLAKFTLDDVRTLALQLALNHWMYITITIDHYRGMLTVSPTSFSEVMADLINVVIGNPRISMDGLMAHYITEAATTGTAYETVNNSVAADVPDGSGLATAADVNKATARALISCTAKVMAYASMVFLRELNDGAKFKDAFERFYAMVYVLDTIGRKTGAQLGITNNNTNAGTIITTPAGVVTRLTEFITNDPDHKKLNAIRATFFNHLGASKSGTFSDIPVTPTQYEIITGMIKGFASAAPMHEGANPDHPRVQTSAKYHTLLSKYNNTNTPRSLTRNVVGMTHPQPTSLHWLDQGNVPEYSDALGVGIEPERGGDNMNVLNPQQVKSADVTIIRNFLATIGRLRFDTVFIRNLVFVVNLYRSVRMKLQRDLVYSKDIILRSGAITRPQLTEFFGNSTYTARADYSADPRYRYYDY